MIGAGKWFGLTIVGAAIIVVVGVSAWTQLESQAGRREQLRRWRDIADLVTRAETGQRGYLLTGDPAYRPPYDTAVLSLEGLRPDWTPSVAPKLAELAETVRLAETGHRDEAVARLKSGSGRRLMESVVAESDARLVAGRRYNDRRNDELLIAIPAAGMTSLALVMWSMVAVYRQGIARALATRLAAEAADRERELRHQARDSEHAATWARRELEERNRTFYSISHDGRYPLQAIVSAIFDIRLTLDRSTPKALLDGLDEIEGHVAMAKGYLDTLLQAARPDTPAPKSAPYDVGDVADEVFRQLHGESDRRGIETANRSRGVETTANRPHLTRIIQNLVANAIKFSGGGTVAIDAAREPGRVRISVADQGQGIPPDKLATLFREFSQVGNPERDPSKGFGLGLSISRDLARGLGGEIAVESEAGVGSTFTVTIPD